MHPRHLLPGFERHLAARAAAPRTIGSYTRTLRAFLGALGDRAPSATDVENFLARIGARGHPLAPSTKRGELMALRAFFRFTSREGATIDPTHGIVVKRSRQERPGVVVMPEEIAPLFDAATRSAARARNLAIVALLFVLGLRVHELVALDATQIDLTALVVRKVRGKGGTETDFPVPQELAEILAAWLRARAMSAHSTDALFLTARPSTSRSGRLSVRSVQRLVARLALEAGLERAIGPHALRHACGTASIRLGTDVPTLAVVMRHANIATTSIYVHIASDARAEPISRLASMIPRSAFPLASGPPSEPRPTQNHSKNQPDDGGQPPVDIQPVMDDIRSRSERGDPASRLPSPPTKRARNRARFQSEPDAPRSDAPGGDHEQSWLHRALDQHLERVRAVLAVELDRALALRLGAGDKLRVPCAIDTDGQRRPVERRREP